MRTSALPLPVRADRSNAGGGSRAGGKWHVPHSCGAAETAALQPRRSTPAHNDQAGWANAQPAWSCRGHRLQVIPDYVLLQAFAGKVASREATSLNACWFAGSDMKDELYRHISIPHPAGPSTRP